MPEGVDLPARPIRFLISSRGLLPVCSAGAGSAADVLLDERLNFRQSCIRNQPTVGVGISCYEE